PRKQTIAPAFDRSVSLRPDPQGQLPCPMWTTALTVLSGIHRGQQASASDAPGIRGKRLVGIIGFEGCNDRIGLLERRPKRLCSILAFKEIAKLIPCKDDAAAVVRGMAANMDACRLR